MVWFLKFFKSEGLNPKSEIRSTNRAEGEFSGAKSEI